MALALGQGEEEAEAATGPESSEALRRVLASGGGGDMPHRQATRPCTSAARRPPRRLARARGGAGLPRPFSVAVRCRRRQRCCCVWRRCGGCASRTRPPRRSPLLALRRLPPANHVTRCESTQALVFSSYTTFLDLLQPLLRRGGVGTARVDGGQSMAERERQIDSFRAPGGPPVPALFARARRGPGAVSDPSRRPVLCRCCSCRSSAVSGST